jgi:hypothetical protein
MVCYIMRTPNLQGSGVSLYQRHYEQISWRMHIVGYWQDTLPKSEFTIDCDEATGGRECGGMSVNTVEPALHVLREEELVEPRIHLFTRSQSVGHFIAWVWIY